MMIDKETLIGLLIETLTHWDENVERFKNIGEGASQLDWFDRNCYADECALCGYKAEYDIERCSDFCPLDDRTGSCSVEWKNLAKKCDKEKATIEDVEAMRNRIQRELDKITAVEQSNES